VPHKRSVSNQTNISACKVSSSNLNEELGEIEYILTDKTGTLTGNKMELKGIVCGKKIFGGKFKNTVDERLYFAKKKEKKSEKVPLEAKNKYLRSFDFELANIFDKVGDLEILPIPKIIQGGLDGKPLSIIATEDPSEEKHQNENQYNGGLPHLFPPKQKKPPKLLSDKPPIDFEVSPRKKSLTRNKSLVLDTSNLNILEVSGIDLSGEDSHNFNEQNFSSNHMNRIRQCITYEELLKELFICALVCHQSTIDQSGGNNKKIYSSFSDEATILRDLRKIGIEYIREENNTRYISINGRERCYKIIAVKSSSNLGF